MKISFQGSPIWVSKCCERGLWAHLRNSWGNVHHHHHHPQSSSSTMMIIMIIITGGWFTRHQSFSDSKGHGGRFCCFRRPRSSQVIIRAYSWPHPCPRRIIHTHPCSYLCIHSCPYAHSYLCHWSQGGGAAQDWGRSWVQCDGREGAEFTNLHIKDHPRYKSWPSAYIQD